MKKQGLWAFLVVIACLATISVLSGGCGAMPSQLAQAQLADTATDLTGDSNKSFSLVSKGTGPNGEDEVHNLNSWTSFDPVEGYGNSNLYGETFIAERVSGSLNMYPIDPRDWLYDKGIGYGYVQMHFEGSFVPGNGETTEAMDELDGIPLDAGGSESIDLFDIPVPVPGCENGEWLNSLTGDKCETPELVPQFYYSWNCHTQYTSAIEADKDWSFANCNVSVNGGTIMSSYVNAGQIQNADGSNEPWPQSEWFFDVTFKVLITGEYEEPVYPTPIPCNEGEDCGKG